MRVRPTGRGAGLLVLGAAVAVTGTALGSTDLVALGAVGVLLVVTTVLLLTATTRIDDRPAATGHLHVRRTVQPDPVPAGTSTQVTVQVTSRRPGRLTGLGLREQAATELAAGQPLRARVSREPGRVRLRYTVTPQRRGRWTVGPLSATRSDPFGVARCRTRLGEAERVTVWPRVVPLTAPTHLTEVDLLEADRTSAVGADAPDDAALRDYQVGDDLRRVHWRSSARRDTPVVRVAERTALRPVVVVLDAGTAPADDSSPDPALERAITLAASAALAAHDSGHPTTLCTGGGPAAPVAVERTDLLDATVDITGHPDAGTAESALRRDLARVDAGALAVAVLGPQGTAGRHALADLAARLGPGRCLAVLRGEDLAAGPRPGAGSGTAEALVRAGWRVVHDDPGTDVAAVWHRLVDAR